MNRNVKRAIAMIFVVDFLVALVLVQQAIISRETIQKPVNPPRIETIGTYAVTIEWSSRNLDDVDLYVRDPKGVIVYFSNPNDGLMNLEHDTIPDSTENAQTRLHGNHERVVIRGTTPGEYIVNVHMYRKASKPPAIVVVKLWRLRGDDLVVKTVTVQLPRSGTERTAFRFTVNSAGNVTAYSNLQRKLISAGPGGVPSIQTAPLPGGPLAGRGGP